MANDQHPWPEDDQHRKPCLLLKDRDWLCHCLTQLRQAQRNEASQTRVVQMMSTNGFVLYPEKTARLGCILPLTSSLLAWN